MDMKITLKVEYKNGRYRQLSWTETDPKVVIEEVDGEPQKTRPAKAEELESSLKKVFAQLMREEKVRSFQDDGNKTIIIRFSEVVDVEFSVKEVIA
jgi:hypothetical protein